MKKLKKIAKKQTYTEALNEILADAKTVGSYDLSPKETKKLEKELRLIYREMKIISNLKYTFLELQKTMTKAEAKEEIADAYEESSKLICIKNFTAKPEVAKLVRTFRTMQSSFMRSVDFGVKIMNPKGEVLKLGKKIP